MHRHILQASNDVISVACPASGLRSVRHAWKTDAYRDGGGINMLSGMHPQERVISLLSKLNGLLGVICV